MDDLPKEISAPISLSCPRCRSSRLWRAGVRHSTFGDQIQRWFCRDCRFRFSDPEDVQKAWSAIERFERQSLKSGDDIVSNSQICVTETKNLAAEQQKTEVLRRNDLSTAKGKIVEYEFWMMKQGYAKTTIEARGRIMNRLVRLGANLYDPEQIKEIIAKQPWSEGRKEIVTETYSNYLVMAGGKWNPPKYHRIEKIPFIPTEQEIDQLIAGCGEKTTALLQALKETGMRVDEAWKLKWTDIDCVNATISITPEKGSHARMFKVSNKLLAKLNTLPKKSDKIFGTYELRGYRSSFTRQRKRTADKLQNPRINQITFPHLTPLESHYGIPQNQRHPLRHAPAWPQEHQKHSDLHTARNIRERRLHLQSSHKHQRSQRTYRSGIRLRLQNRE